MWAASTVCARALLIVERMLEDGALARFVEDRYAGWHSDMGADILGGRMSLADVADAGARGRGAAAALWPAGISGEPDQPICLTER